MRENIFYEFMDFLFHCNFPPKDADLKKKKTLNNAYYKSDMRKVTHMTIILNNQEIKTRFLSIMPKKIICCQ